MWPSRESLHGVQTAGEPLRTAIVDAYAGALAGLFGHLLPAFAADLLLALFVREIPLPDVAGMVARGEAVAGDDVDRGDDGEREATPAR